MAQHREIFFERPVILRPVERHLDPDDALVMVEPVPATALVVGAPRTGAAVAADRAARFFGLFHEQVSCSRTYGAGHTAGVALVVVCATRAGVFDLGGED